MNEEIVDLSDPSRVENSFYCKQVTEEKREKRKITKEMFRKMREHDEEPVVGTFRNLANPGKNFGFAFKLNKGSLVRYCLRDGESYRLQRAVANHLNNSCKEPIYSPVLDPVNKRPTPVKGQFRKRVSFDLHGGGIDYSTLEAGKGT